MTNNDDHKAHLISVFRRTADRFKEHYNQNKHKLSQTGTKLDYRSGAKKELNDYFNDKVRYIDNNLPGSLYEGLIDTMYEGIQLINPIIQTSDGHHRKLDKEVTNKYNIKYNLILADYAVVDLKLMFEIYPLFDNYNKRLEILNSMNAAQQYPDFSYSTPKDSHLVKAIKGMQQYADAEIKKLYETYNGPFTVK